MTDKEILEQYVRQMADELGLKDWRVDILDEPCDNDYHAQIRSIYGMKVAKLQFSKDFKNAEPRSQVETVVHELLHLHIDQVSEILRDIIEPAKVLPKQSVRLLDYMFERQEEFVADGIAKAIAKHYPLIPWEA